MFSEKFKNKYRISSSRHPYHDYAQNGAYAVTICTKNREMLFGKVINKMMCVSEIGGIVDRFWREIPHHLPFVEPDAFIVMPNHIHGIVMILPHETEHVNNQDSTSIEMMQPVGGRDAINRVSTEAPSIEIKKPGGITGDKNPMLHQSLSTIMRWFKGRVSFEIHRQSPDIEFAWQERFYDRIITTEQELYKQRNYILTNPARWEEDEENIFRK